MRGSRIAALAITPPLVGALSLTGASAAFAGNGGGNDSNHSSKRSVSYNQDQNRQGHYTSKHEVSRHHKHIKKHDNSVDVVLVVVYLQFDNTNNCWVYSEKQVDESKGMTTDTTPATPATVDPAA